MPIFQFITVLVFVGAGWGHDNVQAVLNGTSGTSPKPSQIKNASEVSPPVSPKLVNVSVEPPSVPPETKNVSKDGLSVPPNLVNISKEEAPVLENPGIDLMDAQPDPTETIRIARSEEAPTISDEYVEYEEEEYKKIEYTPCGPPLCFARPKCPAPLQNFSRPLLRGQWIGAAYSKTVGVMIGIIWRWLLPNTTVDFEACMYYEYYINEIDTLKFDIMNRDDSFLYYGYDVRTNFIVPGEWQWESYDRLNKFTVWGAGQINETDRMYAWVLLVECDSYDEVWGWTLLINSDLYYETDYYKKNKDMFAAKLEELPGLKFADRLEPDPEEPCRGRWTRRNADDPPWEMPDYMRNDK